MGLRAGRVRGRMRDDVCDLWLRNVFHSQVIHLHFLPVVSARPALIQTARGVWIARPVGGGTPKRLKWRPSVRFVSLRDRVSFMLSLTVYELSGVTFFSCLKCGNRLFRNDSRDLEAPQKTLTYQAKWRCGNYTKIIFPFKCLVLLSVTFAFNRSALTHWKGVEKMSTLNNTN